MEHRVGYTLFILSSARGLDPACHRYGSMWEFVILLNCMQDVDFLDDRTGGEEGDHNVERLGLDQQFTSHGSGEVLKVGAD